MLKLELRPDHSGYSMQDAAGEYFRVLHEGAAGRYGRGISGPKRLPLTWRLESAEYAEWRAFFNARRDDCTSFLIDLMTLEGYPVEHVARFVFDSYKLVEKSGSLFTITCEIVATEKKS